MANREKSARNAAAASYLRGIKGNLIGDKRLTYDQIAVETGIGLDTLKRLMTNKSDFTIDQFLAIANVLGVSDEKALVALADISRQ